MGLGLYPKPNIPTTKLGPIPQLKPKPLLHLLHSSFSTRISSSKGAPTTGGKMEREVAATVRRHPEGGAVTVAGAGAHMAGAVMAAGEEQWLQSRGACSKEKK